MTEKTVKINMNFLCLKKFFMLHQIYFMEYPPTKKQRQRFALQELLKQFLVA